ncbi:MAG: hypothetical protein ISS82_03150 [Nanoarchaeota archaeon]|nr:hypothetical protein [Nanoarchaeota archaeon]
MKKPLLLLLIAIILTLNVHASQITISIPRTSYQVGETIQAEVFLSISPVNELTFSNFEFLKENNEKVSVALFLEKLSNTHYFIYFNIPTSLQKGNYKFKVKNVNYIENNVLKQTSEEKEIYINSINPGFSYLSQQQNADGSFSNIQTTSLAALALKNTYQDKAEQAINYLIQNQDPTGCYPKNNCNIKDTAFALLSLHNFNENIIKTKNWLNDASNNFELGTWSLIISSTNSACVLNGENITITQQQTFPITSKNILINCTQEVTLKLNHFYLGNTYEIFNEQTTYKNHIIDDSGCYGIYYKSTCNYESTAYATWVLQQLNENPSLTYLQGNPSDTQTLDHALLYLITNNQYSFNWLLNNLQNNYWSSQSASLNQNPDNYVSTFAAHSLKNNPIYNNVKSYLYDKTTSNALTSSLILYLLFDDELSQPSISISPGIVNQQNEFTLIITNNQDPITIEIISPNFTSLPQSLLLENSQSFTINIPENTEAFNIEIKYSNISYLIPVLTQQQSNITTTPLLPPPINSILILNFPNLINQTLNPDDKTEDILKFQNTWDFPLNNISFILTGTLGEILTLKQTNFNVIQPNQTLEQTIIINKDRNPQLGEYYGYLIITSQQSTITPLEFNLYFTMDQEPLDEDIEKILEENQGELTNETGEDQQDNGDKTEKKKSTWLWIIPVLLIIIIGLLVFFLKGKKIKTQTFDQYIKNIKR